ncbi:alpha/beta fold hydrolase [Gellertiella hungarica]|uniref:Pyruvate dehydrogenase E2 component (Dihydrolipoamide acetyltransferase) n=1 Tax=Gellertiella hungarica TaxID=1572859 RepID=A0A7W6J3U3_9HYPH|nr:alpha/beta fold hydrolase [Gellertiella hungarica]MBB4063363.1 pyruvate dehydrogenase E2 component (dihydrolipoamide acetyltransferase) [Gellertiella hungarica]
MGLHAESFGRKGGETPLILLHGFGGVSAVWGEVADRLSERVPVLAYDLPGHGRSLSEAPGGAGRMAKALLADLAARGVTEFHLAGHSLGGAVAALMALREPERVRSLTLLAPGGFGPEINGTALSAWRDAADPDALRAALTPMAADGFSFPARIMETLAVARALPGARDALCSIFDAMFVGEGQQGVLPVAELGKLPMPVSVLWGGDDAILPTRQAGALPSEVRVRVLPGHGHMLIEECPDAVAAALAEAVASKAIKGRFPRSEEAPSSYQ